MHKNELTGGPDAFTQTAANWVGTVGKLPLLWKEGDDFYAYYYEITEVSVNGEQVQYSSTQSQDGVSTGETSLFEVTVDQNSNTITNKEKPKQFSLNILKVDNTGQGDPIPLPDAKFELQKVNDDEVASVDGDPQLADTNAQGRIAFAGLENGYYRVTEKIPPAGYVLSADPVFYIKVSNENGVQLLVKGEGRPSTWAVSQTGQQGDVVSFVADQNASSSLVSSTATVKNTPGAALPVTGGMGTTLLTLLGAILVVAAGAVLTIGRRPRLARAGAQARRAGRKGGLR
jgi:LPXTG-motif cell wall-anchored protein